jgi:hypothetical protein
MSWLLITVLSGALSVVRKGASPDISTVAAAVPIAV